MLGGTVVYGPQDAATTDQRANSTGRNDAAVHRQPPYDTICDLQGAPIPPDEVSSKFLDVFEVSSASDSNNTTAS